MNTVIKKLIEDIDQLALWLFHNPSTRMPSQYKQKAEVVLQKIINAEVLSEEEWEKMKPEFVKGTIQSNQQPTKRKSRKKQPSSKKLPISKKKQRKRKTTQPRAHIVRGGLPGLGKR